MDYVQSNANVCFFAYKKHKGQLRIGGLPYITHPVAVAKELKNRGFGEDYVNTALLHDVLEDTSATEEEILALTNKRVLTAVKLLTKEKNYDMNEYIEKIKNNELALMVKLADRLHNLQSSLVAKEKFRKKYVEETKEYYINLSNDTVFENDIKNALQKLEETIRK
ncbi:MAG: hypothetical protein K0R54_654 [Clostridiaceae bacterium]|jgi:GTP pyrophosphokinase|nr:hypothetical protein [Clostridiaceae bacterium]